MFEIKIDAISKAYGRQQILHNINLTVNAGEFICVLGPSGCGKSTLLRILAGLALPDSGMIRIGGRQVQGPGLDRGMVFQESSLFPWLTVQENVELAVGQAFPHQSKRERLKTALRFLQLVGLFDSRKKFPKELSGGMKQRASIARVFAVDPPVLLMDEPFGALDAVTRAQLQELLLKLWAEDGREKKTVVFVTHDVDEALLLADRVVVLSLQPGKIKSTLSVDLDRPRSRDGLIGIPRFHDLRDTVMNHLNFGQLADLYHEEFAAADGAGI